MLAAENEARKKPQESKQERFARGNIAVCAAAKCLRQRSACSPQAI
jgi:hypothetical protein